MTVCPWFAAGCVAMAVVLSGYTAPARTKQMLLSVSRNSETDAPRSLASPQSAGICPEGCGRSGAAVINRGWTLWQKKEAKVSGWRKRASKKLDQAINQFIIHHPSPSPSRTIVDARRARAHDAHASRSYRCTPSGWCGSV